MVLIETLSEEIEHCMTHPDYRCCIFVNDILKENIVLKVIRNMNLLWQGGFNFTNQNVIHYKNYSSLRVININKMANIRGLRFDKVIIDMDIQADMVTKFIKPCIVGDVYKNMYILRIDENEIKESQKIINENLPHFVNDLKIILKSIDNLLKENFKKENNYMNFGQAIEALKNGKKVKRTGWNDKGMFLYMTTGSVVNLDEMKPETVDCLRSFCADKEIQEIETCPYINMKTADDKIVVGWLASQTDMFAEDWKIVE